MADIRTLLTLYISGNISAGETRQLMEGLLDKRLEPDFIKILEELSEKTANDQIYIESDWQAMVRSIVEHPVPIKAIPIFKRNWFWTAAAVFICSLGFAAYLIFRPSSDKALSKITAPVQKDDIAPGGNKATLYLANGARITLDSAKNGQIARIGNTTITKADSGKLVVTTAGSASEEFARMNELRTPRGGIFQLTLPDGTRAWLNAESSVSYPTRFVGKKREVRTTGEVYFEVAKDPAHPFVVSVLDAQVEVLGTHFNINAYPDDNNIKITLFEGSVNASVSQKSKTIKLGEQALIEEKSRELRMIANVDLEKIIAWKNGEMVLNNGSVTQLMREISRWYNVDVEFRGEIPDKKFYGSLNRNLPLSSVLVVLRAYGIKTTLENKKLVVQ